MKGSVLKALGGFDFIFWGWYDWAWPRLSKFSDPRRGPGIVWAWTVNAGPFEIRRRRGGM